MMWGSGPFADTVWGWHFVPMILWWAILALVIVMLVRRVFGFGPRHRHGDQALSILRERYAKGEINKEQFDRMKTDLGG